MRPRFASLIMKGMNKNSRFPSIFKVFLILSVTAFLYLCAIPVAAFLGGRFLVNADEPQPADVVIALGGDSGFDRLEKAAEYYKSGMADALLISDTEVDAYTGQDITVYMRNAARIGHSCRRYLHYGSHRYHHPQ